MCPLNESIATTSALRARSEFDCLDQRPIDLDELRTELGDDAHARVTGTGVVDRDAEAASPQLRGDPLQPREVGHRLTLAELEDDRRRVDTGVMDRLVKGSDPALVDQRADQDVDEEIGLADVGCDVQGRAHAREVDCGLHSECCSRREELIGRPDPRERWIAGERFVGDDRLVVETDDRLECRDDPAAGEELVDARPQIGVGRSGCR